LPTEKAKWTVEQAATNWVRQHAANLKSAKARRNEESLLRQLTKRVGTIKLKSITLDHLKDYQLERSKEVGERAINLELRILVNVLKEANLWASIGEHYKPLKEPESDVGQAFTRPDTTLTFQATRRGKRWNYSTSPSLRGHLWGKLKARNNQALSY
jgi:hypothetical protein